MLTTNAELHPAQRLNQLRHFDGSRTDFWTELLGGIGSLCQAESAILMIRNVEGAPWEISAHWPEDATPPPVSRTETEKLAGTALKGAPAFQKIPDKSAPGILSAGQLELAEDDSLAAAAVILVLPAVSDAWLRSVDNLLRLCADIPKMQSMPGNHQISRTDALAQALDLLAQLNEIDHFLQAAMTLCNELATHFKCDRVSLGWFDGRYITLRAVSHMERFERKMAAIQTLEAAMEEAFDQDEEIIWPNDSDNSNITRDHVAYAREEAVPYVMSLPLRLSGKPIAVLSCERHSEAFNPSELTALRLSVDHITRRLSDLHDQSRWFGARWMSGLSKRLASLLGPDHTLSKLVGILVSAILAALIFVQSEYRVEGAFILKTDNLTHMPAPFEGYIEDVQTEVGDVVKQDQTLLVLDARELLLEESSAIADHTRHLRDADKAQSSNRLADMRVSRALAEQAKARLEQIRYRLDNASLKAPFDGIIVEGNLRELLGAPVRKGDLLFKIARLNQLHIEIKIPEADIDKLSDTGQGEIRFVTRPETPYAIKLDRVDPVATASESGNQFNARAEFAEAAQSWWRPGMTGVAKINAGQRSLLWMLTHKTVDYIRLWLWW